MPPGTFFGETNADVSTPSFDYAEMVALVPDREVPEHTHANAHFIFVLRGTYITEARNRPGSSGAHTLIFNPAGTTHRDRFRTDLGRFFAVSVAQDVAAVIEATHPASVRFDSTELKMLSHQAYREFRSRTVSSDLILEGLGLELAGRAALWQLHPERKAPRWLVEARDSIHDRCTSKMTIGEIARQAQVHPIHLARTFRQYYACSPGEYLRRCRIERVRQLLTYSDIPLAEVSLQTGFSDQSQMTNAFRRLTGMTPRQFRRAYDKRLSSSSARSPVV